MEFSELMLKHIVPLVGIVLAITMFVSPLKAVNELKRANTLGEFNVLPLIMIIANTLAWMIYGSFVKAPYVAAANAPGLILGLYMTFVSYGVSDFKTRDRMLRIILIFASILVTVTLAVALFVNDTDTRAKTMGYQAVGILLCYYSAPMSALAAVIKSRSSASLHAPFSFMSFVNGALWVSYGLALHDAFIWAPNGVGALFGAIQLFLIVIFPKAPEGSIARVQDEVLERAPLTQRA